MSAALPEQINPDDEIAVVWDHTDDGVKIEASLGGVKITVESSYADAPTTPWLVASLPNILEAAWAAIEEAETPEEKA